MLAPPVSLPAASSVGYDRQSGPAESAMGVRIYEDAHDMAGPFGANYAHITFPLSKQRAQVDPDMSTTSGRMGIAAREQRGPSQHR